MPVFLAKACIKRFQEREFLVLIRFLKSFRLLDSNSTQERDNYPFFCLLNPDFPLGHEMLL